MGGAGFRSGISNLCGCTKTNMKYTLVTSKGRIMQFYVEEVARLYQKIHGGVVFCENITKETKKRLTDCFQNDIICM